MIINPLHPAAHWRGWHSLGLLALLLGILLSRLVLPVSPRLWTWLSLLVLLGLFALIVGHGITGRWLGVLIDTRNKVSLSRFQLVLWTVVILSGYLTAVLVNLDLGQPLPLNITIPPEVWVLMGISTTSLVGSPLLLNLKRAQMASDADREQSLQKLAQQSVDTAAVQIQGVVVQNTTLRAAQWSDLFRGSQMHDAGQVDLGGQAPVILLHAGAGAGLQRGLAGAVRTGCRTDPESAGAGWRHAGAAGHLARRVSGEQGQLEGPHRSQRDAPGGCLTT